MMEREEYTETVVDFLERIPPEVIVERVSGDAPPDYLIEPRWCLEKSALRLEIERTFECRGTKQGDRYRAEERQEISSADCTPAAILQRIETSRKLPVLKMKPSS